MHFLAIVLVYKYFSNILAQLAQDKVLLFLKEIRFTWESMDRVRNQDQIRLDQSTTPTILGTCQAQEQASHLSPGSSNYLGVQIEQTRLPL